MRRLLLLLAAGGVLAGCSAVKHAQVRPDWATVDALRVKRLLVVTAPFTEGGEATAQLWSRMARRTVNQRRDFIAKEEKALPSLEQATALCGEGIEGVLWLRPSLERKGSGVEARVNASLNRCVDGEAVWTAEAAGSWPSVDPEIEGTVASFAAGLDASVQPYAAPSFRLLKATLDTLPNPVLNEQDTDEKIELAE
jgi:probable lipoprotein (TIGR04455 family)